ncbi:hypothetical protein RSSM_00774 [Rhodopirellula sallentina SM41]|uniref:Uncharacterized protein n=1 Tax=Rhodopirellula sallentina SM41 TaxID=1263870 RepID=M5U8Q1_9BACT|nr:hypothetical protein RSSM_00774 [Rhodopirellula sallentina SM41]
MFLKAVRGKEPSTVSAIRRLGQSINHCKLLSRKRLGKKSRLWGGGACGEKCGVHSS